MRHVYRTKAIWLVIILAALSVGGLLGWWYVHEEHGHDQHAGHDLTNMPGTITADLLSKARINTPVTTMALGWNILNPRRPGPGRCG